MKPTEFLIATAIACAVLAGAACALHPSALDATDLWSLSK